MGNLRSVVRAFQAVGANTHVTSDPAEVRSANRVVFPGQGAFGQCMGRLRETGMGDALREHWAAERPYLGICLGLQVLFDASEEHGPVAGFGLVPGRVVRFDEGLADVHGRRLKVPHMGWNTVHWTRDHAVTADEGAESSEWFYFVHSYYVVPEANDDILATADHGGPFTVAIARGPMVGVQFHPEKSHAAGLELLQRFLTL